MSDSKNFIVQVVLPPTAGISQTGGSTSLSFPTLSGKNYKVQWTDDLGSHVWTDLPNSLTAGDGSTKTVSDNTGQTQRFYRIVPLD